MPRLPRPGPPSLCVPPNDSAIPVKSAVKFSAAFQTFLSFLKPAEDRIQNQVPAGQGTNRSLERGSVWRLQTTNNFNVSLKGTMKTTTFLIKWERELKGSIPFIVEVGHTIPPTWHFPGSQLLTPLRSGALPTTPAPNGVLSGPSHTRLPLWPALPQPLWACLPPTQVDTALGLLPTVEFVSASATSSAPRSPRHQPRTRQLTKPWTVIVPR